MSLKLKKNKFPKIGQNKKTVRNRSRIASKRMNEPEHQSKGNSNLERDAGRETPIDKHLI